MNQLLSLSEYNKRFVGERAVQGSNRLEEDTVLNYIKNNNPEKFNFLVAGTTAKLSPGAYYQLGLFFPIFNWLCPTVPKDNSQALGYFDLAIKGAKEDIATKKGDPKTSQDIISKATQGQKELESQTRLWVSHVTEVTVCALIEQAENKSTDPEDQVQKQLRAQKLIDTLCQHIDTIKNHGVLYRLGWYLSTDNPYRACFLEANDAAMKCLKLAVRKGSHDAPALIEKLERDMEETEI